MATRKMKNGRVRWVGRVQRDGQVKQRIFDTKKAAVSWEVEMRDKASWDNAPNLLTQESTTTVTALQWTNAYLDFVVDRNMSKKTYDEKVNAIRRFFNAYPKNAPVEEIQVAHAYAVLRKRAKTSGHASNKDRKNMVAAWTWGVKYMGLPEKNPFQAVDRFGEERNPKYVPSEEDFWKVYDAAETEQDRTMLLCYLHTGARKSEILNLLWNDIDFTNSRIRLWTRKRQNGNKECDWLPMTQQLHAALLAHKHGAFALTVFARRKGQKYTMRQHWLRYLCGKAGVRYFTIHAIRHLTASILDQEGMPLTAIQSVLRHKSATTTARYLHSLRGTRAALDEVFSRGRILKLEKREKAQEVAAS